MIKSIEPCLKISQDGEVIYVCEGEHIHFITKDDTDIEGRFQHLELSKYDEEDDIIYILLDDNTQYNIGSSYIKKIIR